MLYKPVFPTILFFFLLASLASGADLIVIGPPSLPDVVSNPSSTDPTAPEPQSLQELRNLSIEELMMIEIETVFSTSKHEQKVSEAPSAVTIITANDIRTYGYRTLADILKAARGFSVTYDRNYNYLGVRGFGRPGDYNTRVLLLVDGHRMNENVYDRARIGTDFILDVDLIDRVEISRGPGSSLYGSNAFFGIVNIITRHGREIQGMELAGEAGTLRTAKGRASVGGVTQGTGEGLLSGTGYSSRGDRLYYREYDQANPFFDPRGGNNGIAEYRDYDRHQSVFTRESWSGLTLEGAFSKRTKGIPTASYGTDFNADNKTTDQRGYVDLQYRHAVTERTELNARLSYDRSQYQGDYFYAGILNKDWSYGAWAGGEARIVQNLSSTHRLIVGGEYIGNRRQDQQNYDLEPFAPYFSDDRRSRTWAVYIQDELAFAPVLHLTAGIRYDHSSPEERMVNPRIAAILAPANGSILKFLYGSAFRSPSVYERYYQSPTSAPPLLANPALKPEKIKTYEFVYEQYLGRGLRATLDGYQYRIEDLIDQSRDAAGNLSFKNIEETVARGVELEIEKKWADGVNGRISYALQRATNARTGEVLDNSPRETAKLNLMVPLFKASLFAGIEEQYTSSRKTVSGAYTGDFYVTNLTIFGRSFERNLEVSASLYNVFNRDYSDPVSTDLEPLFALKQDGRAVRIKVLYSF